MQAQEINGTYSGTLEVQGMEMELLFSLTSTKAGLSATMDVPMQGATDIPMDSATLKNGELTITSAKLKLDYVGVVNGESITGTYKQMGQEYPLNLKKTIKTKPGNTALPSSDSEIAKLAAKEQGNYKYEVEDYFKTPEAYSFKLSPNGTFIAYMKRRDTGERDLYLKETASQKETLLMKQGEDLIRGYAWANDNRILYLQDKGGDENYHLFGVDVDGNNAKELTPYEGVKVNIIAGLKEDKNHVIVQMNKDNAQQEEPYKLNINTGEAIKLYTVNAGDPPVAGYNFDRKGNLRALTRIVDGTKTEVLYKIDGDFQQIVLADFGDSFGISSFNPSTDYPHDAYVLSNLGTDKLEIQLYDLKENTMTWEYDAIVDADKFSIRLYFEKQ